MATQIFINLPVKDLSRSMEFFKKLGFSFNMQFTNEEAACLVIAPNIFAMLLTEKRFQDFTKKKIADARETTEVLLAIDVASRDDVNDLVQKAVAAGGSIYAETQDHGWMYAHSFADPDGHQWEVLFIDAAAMPADVHS